MHGLMAGARLVAHAGQAFGLQVADDAVRLGGHQTLRVPVRGQGAPGDDDGCMGLKRRAFIAYPLWLAVGFHQHADMAGGLAFLRVLILSGEHASSDFGSCW